jgi:hypothetical protein
VDANGRNGRSVAGAQAARLHRAELGAADLTGANLRGAQIATPDLGRTNLTRAKVHHGTCWGIPTKGDRFQNRADKRALDEARATPTSAGARIVTKLRESALVPQTAGQALGHICTKSEGGLDLVNDASRRIYICPEEPYLRKFEKQPPGQALLCTP